MKYIKLFENKIDLNHEFQSIIDIIKGEKYVHYEPLAGNRFRIEFFENEVEINSTEDLDKASEFAQIKTDIINDLKVVCRRLEDDGYFLKIDYRITYIQIDILENKVEEDNSIQGWLKPIFGETTSLIDKEKSKIIKWFEIDKRKMKKWFQNEYDINDATIRYDDRKNEHKIIIYCHDRPQLTYEFCHEFLNKLESFKDKEGNIYRGVKNHSYPDPKHKGATFNLYQTYNNSPIYSIHLQCSLEIYFYE